MWWLLKSLGQLGPTRWYLMDGGMGGGEGGYKGGGGWGSSIPCTGMHRSGAQGPPPLLISSHSKLNLVFFLFLQPGAGEGILGIQVLSNRSNPAKGTIGIQAHVTLRPHFVLTIAHQVERPPVGEEPYINLVETLLLPVVVLWIKYT